MMDRPGITKEQFDWLAEYNQETNEFYIEKDIKLKKLNKLKNDISKSITGYGRAIDELMNKLEEIKNDVELLEIQHRTRNCAAEFSKKFGVNYFDFNTSKIVKTPAPNGKKAEG